MQKLQKETQLTRERLVNAVKHLRLERHDDSQSSEEETKNELMPVDWNKFSSTNHKTNTGYCPG